MRIPLAIVMGSVLFYCNNPRRENPYDVEGENWHPPSVTAMQDTSVNINDSITIFATGTDANGTVVMYAWAKNGTSYADTTTTGALKVAYPDSGRKMVQVKAIDNDGLASQPDSCMVSVTLDPPVVTARNDSTVSFAACSSVTVTVSAHDINASGSVVRYFWDRGLDGWDDSTTVNSYAIATTTGGPVWVRWQVRDDDNLLSLIDTFKILFNRPPSSPTISAPTATTGWISFNLSTGKGTLPLTISASDPDSAVDTITYTLSTGPSAGSMTQVYSGRGAAFNLTGVDTSATVYWKLVARDLFGDSAIGTGSFIAPSYPPPAVPTLSSPPDLAIDVSLMPTLVWSDTSGLAASYHLQVAIDSAFASLIVNNSILTSTSMTLASPLAFGTKYYWRVNATNPIGTSVWSAVWSFTTLHTWNALGSGMNSWVVALAFDYSGNLYAGGWFTTAGGATANHIAKWNGSAWSALGSGMDSVVYCLAFDGSGNLYAGGHFTTAGGIAARHIARWNGSAWSALGSGTNGFLNALAFDDHGNLYAGGNFTTAGGVAANSIAKWNGSAWSALGSGTNGAVEALAVDGSGNLYAGGAFTTAGGITAKSIAKWDGNAWSSLGSGMNLSVYALANDSSGNLYAGGNFSTAGGIAANYIAKWNGSAWSALGSGTTNWVFVLAFEGQSGLYAGGDFTTAGGITANHVARWYGTAWSALGSGTSNNIHAIAVDGSGNLYVGGWFTAAGGITANYIAKCK